jgi:peptidoglycan/LPS O-acetylase OafA/YrhL
MKKVIVIFVIAGLVLVSFIVWIMNTAMSWNFREILMIVVGLVMIGFALYAGYKRVKSFARKEPVEDELSKMIMTRATSISYYISIYLWLFIMYISDKIKWETHTLIGTGILGMSLVFLFSWLGVKFFGLKND